MNTGNTMGNTLARLAAAVLTIAACTMTALCLGTGQAQADTVKKAGWYIVSGGAEDNGYKTSWARINKKTLKVRAVTFKAKGKRSLASRSKKLKGRSHRFVLSKKVRFYDLEESEFRLSAAETRDVINRSGDYFPVLVVHVKNGKVDYIGLHS